MQVITIPVADSFRQNARRAILSILLFVLVYLLLAAAALALTVLCFIGGIGIVSLWPSLITLGLGIGLAGMGVLILIFLVKFIFKQHRVDRSHLVEITANQEPALFSFIQAIAQEVGTKPPKHVYLSAEVNASVFYDSSFWSMFFPVRKNLQIGMALVNAVSEQEFRAILAHEFGHFSQRSMKVGSYVYHVNQAIYNMLYDNSDYEQMAVKWANLSGYFALFVGIVVRVIRGIQWILQRVYAVVNINYMGLSREMEFHADAVAAQVAGSRPLATALLRLGLAETSYNSVLSYYSSRVKESIVTDNVYPQYKHVMNLLSVESNLPQQHGLPLVTSEYLSRFNRSRLVIKDQWASHPTTEERTHALEALRVPDTFPSDRLAIQLFSDGESVNGMMTRHLFSSVQYPSAVTTHTYHEFATQFEKEFSEQVFHPVFRKYYDNHNPSRLEIDSLTPLEETVQLEELFAEEFLDHIYTELSLQSDLATLRQLGEGKTGIKSFDYAGKRYPVKEALTLVPSLEQEAANLDQRLIENDTRIARYFLAKAKHAGRSDAYKTAYQKFLYVRSEVEKYQKIYPDLHLASQFIFQTLPVDQIEFEMRKLRTVETDLIVAIKWILGTEEVRAELSVIHREAMEKFCEKPQVYFFRTQYNQEALDALFNAANAFQEFLGIWYIRYKKNLLDLQAELAGQ